MRRSVIALTVVMAVVAAGCGSESSDDGLATLENADAVEDSGSGDAALDAEESILALTECMRVEGVDIPDPEFDDQGNLRLQSLAQLGEAAELIDPDDLEAAVEACDQHLVGVAQMFQNIDRTAIEDRLVEFAVCMRGQGIDMPDPDFGFFDMGMGTGGNGADESGPFGELDVDDPAFQAAYEECQGVFGETIGTGGFGPSVDGDGN